MFCRDNVHADRTGPMKSACHGRRDIVDVHPVACGDRDVALERRERAVLDDGLGRAAVIGHGRRAGPGTVNGTCAVDHEALECGRASGLNLDAVGFAGRALRFKRRARGNVIGNLVVDGICGDMAAVFERGRRRSGFGHRA